ncbi:MAG: OmpA family protein [Nitrospirae bacterium]|nr:OmpA family protein [Candidatus Troglogloeales bacterium]
MKTPRDRRIEPRQNRRLVFYEPAADVNYFDEGGNVGEELQDLPTNQWAIQWGDLMMTMFVFFAMLYAYHLSERDAKEAFRIAGPEKIVHEQTIKNLPVKTPIPVPTLTPGPAESVGAGLTPEQILELSEKAAKETNIDDVDIVLQDDHTVKISLRGPLLFDTGSAELREETIRFLQKVAFVLTKTNNEVNVVGHTDNFPIHSDRFPTNWELSSVRAARVARYLIQQGPLDPGRFTVMGNALYRPLEPNTSPESKQRNRRVEIVVTRKVYVAPENMY